MEVRKKWVDLKYSDKEPYITKAKYLVERGYIDGDVNSVARTLYEKDHKKV